MLNTGSTCTKCGRRAPFVDDAGHCPDCMEPVEADALVLHVASSMWQAAPHMAHTAAFDRQPQTTRDFFMDMARAAIRAMTASEPETR